MQAKLSSKNNPSGFLTLQSPIPRTAPRDAALPKVASTDQTGFVSYDDDYYRQLKTPTIEIILLFATDFGCAGIFDAK